MNKSSKLDRCVTSLLSFFRQREEMRIMKRITLSFLLLFLVSFTARAYSFRSWFIVSDTLPVRNDSLKLGKDSLLSATDSMALATNSLIQMMDSLAKEAAKPAIVDSNLLQCYVVDSQTGDSIPYANAVWVCQAMLTDTSR